MLQLVRVAQAAAGSVHTYGAQALPGHRLLFYPVSLLWLSSPSVESAGDNIRKWRCCRVSAADGSEGDFAGKQGGWLPAPASSLSKGIPEQGCLVCR